MHDIIKELSAELGQKEEYVKNVVTLMDEGNTIPFIARYRKEAHGAMDDTSLRKLEERLTYLRNLQARREEILKALENRGARTPALEQAVDQAATLSELEDIYRPYKQKRRTRATIARERGLEPLALALFSQKKDQPDPLVLAEAYTDAATGKENGVLTARDALDGASDILAENISDTAAVRRILREFVTEKGLLTTTAATEEDSVYRLYYEFSQPIRRLQGHQILAINRGEKEKYLKVSIETDHERMLSMIARPLIRRGSHAAGFIEAAARDSLERLLLPSIEREIRSSLTEKACEGAIQNFAINLRPLLMQPPVKGHVTMGLDPGYRMGCKVAVIDGTGKVLDTTVVYPTHGDRKKAECIRILKTLIKKHQVEHIAIGNGTASRETEQMTAELIAQLNRERTAGKPIPKVSYAIVNEAGASVYSASELAAKEFPDFDVNLRSAVSIARRLQDPLAELVKIDPKAIGVGQYQHDMPQKQLNASLSAVVEDCVNAVGVDVNTASPSLLSYVSGITSSVASNILIYREANGAFTSRSQLKKVPKLGPKAFEQCAGFLRVPESSEILDHTGVHPESYGAAKQMLETLGFSEADIRLPGKRATLPDQVKQYGTEKLAKECGIGVPTLEDIVQELAKPGRDPREELPPVLLRQDVLELSDLTPGMKLTGTVRNVIDFGVFVDIGVHQDGLVHISEICDHFIKHPSEILSVGDIVDVVVLDVNEKRKRISLSIKQAK